jgi:hypothetical protein
MLSAIRLQRLLFKVPLLALIFLFLSFQLSHAALCFPSSSETDSAYQYLVSLTESLGYAKTAIERHLGPENTSFEGDMFNVLYAHKLAKGDFECAASQVAPYTKSPNEAIQTSAIGVGTVFMRLAELQDNAVDEWTKTLDAGPKGFKQGTFLERQAARAVMIDETWKVLVPSVIAATYSVIEKDPQTGLMSRLGLTTKERDEILQNLRSTFGEEIKKGMQAGQISLVAAASVLYEVLWNQHRKTRNEK